LVWSLVLGVVVAHLYCTSLQVKQTTNRIESARAQVISALQTRAPSQLPRYSTPVVLQGPQTGDIVITIVDNRVLPGIVDNNAMTSLAIPRI
jgi:hypothetical protein